MSPDTSSVPIVTIDGPSSSGKGTISRIVASRVGWQLLDSGALYRLVALGGILKDLDPDDVAEHVAVARSMRVEFGLVGAGEEKVLLDGRDVTHKIRSEQAGAGASRVAAWPAVRTALFDRQRSFAQPPGLVADGRDMGTVIFPEARLKVFLTATAEERAQRRHKQLIGKGPAASLAALSREIAERDLRDSTRQVAPLKPAPDALILDSTGLSIEAVVERVLSLGRERNLWR
ncbi:MAG TPA: (d)CMP kinase [Steroidobacteraceae bacterium]|nr:(d)CMP kinase [Steroidobacteraceae bacterium]